MPKGIFKNPKERAEKIRRAQKGRVNFWQIGKKSHNWRGGKTKENGYVKIYKPEYRHHNRKNRGYVMEHRYIMQKHMGRKLESWEHVHHRNGIKDDNRIENLEIVLNKKHYGKIQCPHCRNEFLIQ